MALPNYSMIRNWDLPVGYTDVIHKCYGSNHPLKIGFKAHYEMGPILDTAEVTKNLRLARSWRWEGPGRNWGRGNNKICIMK